MVSKKILRPHEWLLAVTIILLAAAFSSRSADFLTLGNLYDLVNNYAMLLILACGLFIVLISGGVDISFPAITIIASM